MLHSRVEKDLLAGSNVIYDATNLNSKRRKNFLQNLTRKGIEATKKCRIILAPVSVCVNRDKERDRHVGERIILRQLNQFQTPYYDEGWDEIELVFTHTIQLALVERDFIDVKNRSLKQDNPWHSFSVGEHCELVQERIDARKLESPVYSKLGRLHDIGKYYTKTIDEKGVGHFYGHESPSAYWALFPEQGIDNDTALKRSYVISLHMRRYGLMPEHYKRWLLSLPKDIAEAVYILNLADYDKDE